MRDSRGIPPSPTEGLREDLEQTITEMLEQHAADLYNRRITEGSFTTAELVDAVPEVAATVASHVEQTLTDRLAHWRADTLLWVDQQVLTPISQPGMVGEWMCDADRRDAFMVSLVSSVAFICQEAFANYYTVRDTQRRLDEALRRAEAAEARTSAADLVNDLLTMATATSDGQRLARWVLSVWLDQPIDHLVFNQDGGLSVVVPDRDAAAVVQAAFTADADVDPLPASEGGGVMVTLHPRGNA